jgi:pyruvate/2-oxoglutarate/acetoin dehydrogenase E1 component
VDGREVIRSYFNALFERDPKVVAIGEDIGFDRRRKPGICRLAGKIRRIRITDTGIREATIVGQGIGLAMRGLRPDR